MIVPTKAKTLIIDLNPNSGLSHLLREMLAASENLLVHSYLNLSEPTASCDLARRLTSHPSIQNVDLIFMTMPTEVAVLSKALLEISGEHDHFPHVIAVFQDMIHEQAIELLNAGIADFITPPFKTLDILPRIWRLSTPMTASETFIHDFKEKFGLQQIVGKSRQFLSEVEKIPRIAKASSTVLITGETGTGKELCTRAIHYLGPRSGKPFIPVNCGAIPVDLVENELFGHSKGAYTGADESREGLIREAHEGTLFLDEIESLSLSAQVKLLRFLQDKEYRQLGSVRIIRSNVRVVAATNTRLDLAVKEGSFRRDLYYRLNVIPMSLPPLRDHREDIPLLAKHFLRKHAVNMGQVVDGFSARAMQKLMLYDWPGNVRELENVIERALVFSKQAGISAADIVLTDSPGDIRIESLRDAKAKVVEQFERDYIQSLLLAHEGNISRASKTAGKNRRAFWELIRKYGIDAQGFKPQQP